MTADIKFPKLAPEHVQQTLGGGNAEQWESVSGVSVPVVPHHTICKHICQQSRNFHRVSPVSSNLWQLHTFFRRMRHELQPLEGPR